MSKDTNIHDNNGNGPHPEFRGNGNPFNAGADYFESFAQKIQSRVDAFEEIKNEAPLLSNIPKYNPFDVPAGYFDELPALVQQRCIHEKARTPLIDWLLFIIRPRFALPVLSVLVIAFGGIYYVNNTVVKTETAATTEEISIDDQLQNIDETMIIEALTAQATIETGDTENDRIVDYLLENDVDEASLNTEL